MLPFLTLLLATPLAVTGSEYLAYNQQDKTQDYLTTGWGIQQAVLNTNACPDYTYYSAVPHPPFSEGPLKLPFQRPVPECRLFRSQSLEKKLLELKGKMKDVDLARLFENAWPNTLDTTVRWHVPEGKPHEKQSFIVTGDINAQWLRDSTNQLSQYQFLAKDDEDLRNLILGAINTQADFVLKSPYCNAFQPPAASGLSPSNNGQDDTVNPVYDNHIVFECKYEVDSLASFLSLGNQYYAATGDSSFVTSKWLNAVQQLLIVLQEQSVGTFREEGGVNDLVYTFQRRTNTGTETLNLAGTGNPLASGTGLIRSAFRPSDDACIMQYFIPGNAFLSVELSRTATLLSKLTDNTVAKTLHPKLSALSTRIKDGIYKHGVVTHPTFGKVFAYETDGYGSHIFLDDANLPSLLSLPLLGFIDAKDELYQNTRKMVLSVEGNPYYLKGKQISGIGGPHVGIRNVWPISLLVQAMTSEDDKEILELLETVKKVSINGVVNESVHTVRPGEYTRSWFAWANSVLAETVLELVRRKPGLVLKSGETVEL
ncbi:DUF1237 domain-containing protein [Ascobolus immersus RN42]|uniref:DUF1237 domain-containing protein n=1 Tax=Ascobolus immersus RN42 TaxID=1160509 RepID=A0A3N4I929_ASCIM|nr:DUF1237 domain-containing protein [Ascobolus immersus RN42]